MTIKSTAPNCESLPTTARRHFLKGLAAIGALALAPGVVLYRFGEASAAEAGVSSKVRWGMLIDINKCQSGCSACVTACSKENGWNARPPLKAPLYFPEDVPRGQPPAARC